MKKIWFGFALVISMISASYGQEELFKVLINKGKNTLDNSKAVVTGTKVHKNQIVNVVETGYIGLVYKNGKSIELKVPGNYSANDLEKQALATSSSFTKKYADFVLSEMTKSNESLTDNRKKNMSVTGSVERGDEKAIKILSPKTSDLLFSQAVIKWQKTPAATGYVIKVKDMFDEPLKSYETDDTSLAISVSELNLKQSKQFIYSIVAKNAKDVISDDKSIKVLEGSKSENLKKEMASIKQEAGENSALGQIILASFCEQNKLYIEAVEYYEAAIRLEPEVEEYKYAYRNFLNRHGLL